MNIWVLGVEDEAEKIATDLAAQFNTRLRFGDTQEDIGPYDVYTVTIQNCILASHTCHKLDENVPPYGSLENIPRDRDNLYIYVGYPDYSRDIPASDAWSERRKDLGDEYWRLWLAENAAGAQTVYMSNSQLGASISDCTLGQNRCILLSKQIDSPEAIRELIRIVEYLEAHEDDQQENAINL